MFTDAASQPILNLRETPVVTWFKTHEITSHHINYSIAYPKPRNKRVLLGYCYNFVSLKPDKNQNSKLLSTDAVLTEIDKQIEARMCRLEAVL